MNYLFCSPKPIYLSMKEKDYSEGLGLDEKIILEWLLGK
jgi:hypothetical protein